MRKQHWTQTPEGKKKLAQRSEKARLKNEAETMSASAAPSLDDFTAAVKAVAKVTRQPWDEAVRTLMSFMENAKGGR